MINEHYNLGAYQIGSELVKGVCQYQHLFLSNYVIALC